MCRRISLHGYSLVELLTVIAVIAVLSALMFGVLAPARSRAKETDNLSKLHQFAAAAVLYQEANNEIHPMGTAPLVSNGLIPEELCASANDPYADGITNAMLKTFGPANFKGAVVSYKSSFVGARECQLGLQNKFDRFVKEDQTGGWLVDTTPMTPVSFPDPLLWSGPYRRLLNSGSVVTRTLSKIPCRGGPEGKSEGCLMHILFFVDPNEELKTWASS